MNILITGASGFIGNHLYHALLELGHHVTGVSREKIANINWEKLDFDQSPQAWQEKLEGVDLVINAAGIYQQTRSDTFIQVHNIGPAKLFEACEKNDIRVIQISAIGAEKEKPLTEFLQSKREADQRLLKSKIPHSVLYPGIVLGEGGRSTMQLSCLARLFCRPMIFSRHIKLPLISIYQITEHIVNIINHPENQARAEVLIALPETTENLLNNLQRWQHSEQNTAERKPCFLYVPQKLIRCVFGCFPGLHIASFNKQSLNMIDDFSATNYTPVSGETASASLLMNRASESFNKKAEFELLYYFNLLTLSIIWLVSGAVSLISIEKSRELISHIGLQQGAGDGMIVISSIVDILLGLLLWVPQIRRRVIYLQLVVMFIYSLIISVLMPVYWFHPFAPIVKNLAMLMLALYVLTENRK